MSLVAKLFVLLNRLMSMGLVEFRAFRRGTDAHIPPGWILTHHEIEGRNGGLILVPMVGGVVWPRFLGLRFRLAARQARRMWP